MSLALTKAGSYMVTGKVACGRELYDGGGVQSAAGRKASVPDAEIIARVRGGDKESYRVLVEKYERRAFAIAFAILKSKEDAEDIVQESFVKAFLGLAEFRGGSSFYTWLYRIVYNMAIDFKRKLARRGGSGVEFDEANEGHSGAAKHALSADIAGPHETVVRKEFSFRLRHVLAELSEEHRAVIMLREVDGLDYREISQIVGVSRGTVMSRLHYARKKMQQALRDLAPHKRGGNDAPSGGTVQEQIVSQEA